MTRPRIYILLPCCAPGVSSAQTEPVLGSDPVVVSLALAALFFILLSIFFAIRWRRLKESLARSARRLEFVVEVSREGMWDWNILTDECYFSPRWCESLLLDPETTSAHISSWEQRVHPDDLEEIKSRIQRHFDGETDVYESEHRLLRADGEYVWHLVRAKLVERTTDGRPSRMIGVEMDITERREMELLLREKESQLEAIFEYSPAEIYLKDAMGHYVRISREFERRFGVRNEDLVGKLPHSAHYDELAEKSREQDLQVLSSGKPTMMEQDAILAVDNEVHTLLTLKFPTFDDRGAITGIGAIVTDITDQKRAEEARVKSESLLHSLTENMPIGLSVKDLQGRYQLANRAFLSKLHLQEADVIGRPADDFFSESNCREIRRHEREALDSGRPVAHEERLKWPDGLERVDMVTRFPVRDPEGAIVGVGVLDVDITDRKSAENFLRSSERRLRLIADNVPGMLARVDAQRRFRFVNREAENWLGLPEDRIIGRHLREVLGDAAYETASPYIDRALAGETVHFEMAREFRFGKSRWAAGTLAPDLDDRGDVRGYFALLVDVSDRKAAEDKARRAQVQLLERQRREKDMVQKELERVRDELVRHTRFAAVGQVAASVAHDLRNPLGAIRNAAFYLRRKLPGDGVDWSEYLDIIEQEIVSSDRIISDLMDMTRITEPHKSDIDLASAVDASWRRLQSHPGVALDIQCSARPFTLYADPDQFGRVLDNLLLNAAQAMNGGGKLWVEAESSDGYDVIGILDEGPGVNQKIRDRIFEPLVTDKAKGTGLGLSICRQIVERHGGDIGLAASASPGAELIIRLPRSPSVTARQVS